MWALILTVRRSSSYAWRRRCVACEYRRRQAWAAVPANCGNAKAGCRLIPRRRERPVQGSTPSLRMSTGRGLRRLGLRALSRVSDHIKAACSRTAARSPSKPAGRAPADHLLPVGARLQSGSRWGFSRMTTFFSRRTWKARLGLQRSAFHVKSFRNVFVVIYFLKICFILQYLSSLVGV